MLNDYKNINWKKVFWAGFLFLIISTVFRQIEVAFTMNYYLLPQYFDVWSKVMMPNAGPPPPSFMVLSAVFTFITGVTVATLYDYLKDRLPKTYWQKVVAFSDIIIGLSIVLFTLPVYLLINVPARLLLIWLTTSIVTTVIYSMVLVKVVKK